MIDKRFSIDMSRYSLSMIMLKGDGYEIYLSCHPHFYAGIMDCFYRWQVQVYYPDRSSEYGDFTFYREVESWLEKKGCL